MSTTLDIQLIQVSRASLCPYCRCAAEGEALWTCPGCRLVLHQECSAELSSCPTVGCEQGLEAPRLARRTRPRRERSLEGQAGAGRSELTSRLRAPRGMVIGRTREDESWPTAVYVVAAILCLIPCLGLGLQVGWSAAQTTYFGVDWWCLAKVCLTVTGLTLPLLYMVGLPITGYARDLWRFLRRR